MKCVVCGQYAPFAERDLCSNERAWYCRIHVPGSFDLPASLLLDLEKEIAQKLSAAGASNTSAHSTSVAIPSNESNPFSQRRF